MDERYRAGNKKDSMDRYWAYKNAWSMDGLPGLKRGVEAGRNEGVEPVSHFHSLGLCWSAMSEVVELKDVRLMVAGTGSRLYSCEF